MTQFPFSSFVSVWVQDPVRSAIIDSCIRVTDNGRESVHRSVRPILLVLSLLHKVYANNSLSIFLTIYLIGLLHIHTI
jgi:hypothetical protein